MIVTVFLVMCDRNLTPVMTLGIAVTNTIFIFYLLRHNVVISAFGVLHTFEVNCCNNKRTGKVNKKTER